MIVTDERVARFISEKTGSSFCPPYTVMGWEENGDIISAALFNCFEPPDMHVSIAGKNFPRSFMRSIGDYMFRQLGYSRCTFITSQEHVIDMAIRIGAVKEGVLRSHFGDGKDATVLGMLKSEYRYWKE